MEILLWILKIKLIKNGKSLCHLNNTKYDSGSGWPSFWKPVDTSALTESDDFSLFMRRTEIQCSKCGGHLGHIFEDGPQPTGIRYCINSSALQFKKISDKE